MLTLVRFVLLLVLAAPASAVTMDWVAVGDPNNASDTATNCYAASCGSVSYSYLISKYEVTNAQYAEFLNAKAASDPLGLYSTDMAGSYGGISRSGVSGSYTYSVIADRGSKPVNWVSFYDSLRFVNWLNNGQGSASTETGAYTLLGGTATPSNGLTVTRNAGANIVLTSENEWYKAAYYNAVSASFFDYPAGSDTQTGCVAPASDTGNSANCSSAVGNVTEVGAYALSDSPYGTFDQGGNVWEWNEQIVGSNRGLRGGHFDSGPATLAASYRDYAAPPLEYYSMGFRVASIPEPATGLLVMAGLLGLAGWRRRGV